MAVRMAVWMVVRMAVRMAIRMAVAVPCSAVSVGQISRPDRKGTLVAHAQAACIGSTDGSGRVQVV